jgi:hypothetical protein
VKLLNKKGYTLIEVISTISILFIILAPIILVFNTWYNNFYIDNSKVFLDQKLRDTMDYILSDLRKYGNINSTSKNDNKSLYIDDSLEYTFIDGTLYKNDEIFFEDNNIEIVNFTVEEVKPENYDTSVIKIYIKLVSDYDIESELESIYKKKFSN